MYQLETNRLYDFAVLIAGTNKAIWRQRTDICELLANLDTWADPDGHAVKVDGIDDVLTVGFWRDTVQIVDPPAGQPLFDLPAPAGQPRIRPCKCGMGAPYTECKEHLPACG